MRKSVYVQDERYFADAWMRKSVYVQAVLSHLDNCSSIILMTYFCVRTWLLGISESIQVGE